MTTPTSEERITGHTPGPLSVVDGRGYGIKGVLVTCQIDGGAIPLAEFHFNTGLRGVMLPALQNAALYAAAPELLAVAEHIDRCCHEGLTGEDVRKLRAAIAKATGAKP